MYNAKITTGNRTAFVILCDRSGSMTEETLLDGQRMTKSEAVATIINALIDELLNRCRRTDGLRDYFDLAVIGYSGSGITSLLPGSEAFVSVSELVRMPVPTVRRHILRMLPSGNQIAATIDQHCWIAPSASGNTPMLAALHEAAMLTGRWCAMSSNRDSFPPVVINITDGEASDAGEHELITAAETLKRISTCDGNVLLFNIHLAGGDNPCHTICFPGQRDEIPQLRYAEMLYDMSSPVPSCYDDIILFARPTARPPFSGVAYNCPIDELFDMLAIGTASSSFVL